MALPDRLNSEAKPQFGEMPKPRRMRVLNSSGGYDSFIGIEAYSPYGNFETFFLIHNFKFGNLETPDSRNAASSLVARTLYQTGVELAVGPAVLPPTSQPKRRVATFEDGEWWGVYAKIKPSDIRNFTESLKGLLPEEYFERSSPEGFRAGKALAAAVLPEP